MGLIVDNVNVVSYHGATEPIVVQFCAYCSNRDVEDEYGVHVDYYVDQKAVIRELMKRFGGEVIDIAQRGNVLYIAYELEGNIYAFVAKTSIKSKTVIVANVTVTLWAEANCPPYIHCPKRIVRKLSPTINQKCLAWRNACLA